MSTLFHFSGILGVAYIALIKTRQTKKIKILLITLSGVLNVLANFLSPYIATILPRYSLYADYGHGGGADSSIAILSVILVWSWIYQKRMELKVPYYNYYQNCIAAGLLLNILSSTNVMFGRLGMLFTINLIIFIPLLVNSINRHYKLIIMAISIAYCIWNLSNNNATVVPYDSCF